jgi:hypothetical protein
MHIICLTPLAPGVYNDHKADHITAPPDGWAYIPEDFPLPSTFPRLGSIETEELTYTREVEVQKEVPKTRQVSVLGEDGMPTFDEGGLPMLTTEEYTELETVTEPREYTMMTVTAMTEGTLPEEPTLTPAEQREAAYNTAKIIPWDGDNITVTEAAQLWQYYAAEGNMKAYDLQSLIAKAKSEIRTQYPDVEVAE